MGEETTTLGTITISPSALATIAYHATLTSYGVVGLAPKNLAEGLAMTITHEPARGVSVNYDGETRLGFLLQEKVEEANLVGVIDALLTAWQRQTARRESFGDWCAAQGAAALTQLLDQADRQAHRQGQPATT